VDLVKGQAEVFPKPGKSFDPALIPKAIKDAGFSAPEVVATVAGTLVQTGGRLELNVPGLNHAFVLAGGSQEDALKKRVDLVGKKIRLTGKLHPARGDLPPGLTVESLQAAP
jgi:hypothetical protein